MGLNFEVYQDTDYEDLRKMMVCLYSEDPEGEPMNKHKINNTMEYYERLGFLASQNTYLIKSCL